MSGFAAERTTIGTLFNANWTATDIAMPGDHFTPPARTNNPASPARWVKFDLENVFGDRLTPAWVQYDNAVEIDYFEEDAGQGDNLMRQAIDTIMAIFREAHTATIYYSEPFLEPSGIQYPGAEGEWRQATIRIPFRRFADVS